MSTDNNMATERVTRSKAPKRLSPEPEPESESRSKDDEAPYSSVLNPGRIQQPPVTVLSNLMTVKTEVHYNPIIAPKKEEEQDEVNGEMDIDEDAAGVESGVQETSPNMIKAEAITPPVQVVDDRPAKNKRRRVRKGKSASTVKTESASNSPINQGQGSRARKVPSKLSKEYDQTRNKSTKTPFSTQPLHNNHEPDVEIKVEDAESEVQDFSSPTVKLFNSLFLSRSYEELVIIIRENREQGKYSEDELCTAAINWLKHQSKERSPKMKELLDEFPDKEHKGRIIQSLFQIPGSAPDLQKGAFALLMEVYLSKDSDKITTTAPKQTSSNTTDTRVARSTPVYQADSSSSQPTAKKTKLSTLTAKIANNNGTEQEGSSKKRDKSSSAGQEKALQNTSVTQRPSSVEPLISQRPTLSIRFSPSEIFMVKTVQGQKVPRKFESISKLVTELNPCDQDYEIWLKIWKLDAATEDVKMFLTKFATAITNLELHQKRIWPSTLQKQLCGLPNLTRLTLAKVPLGKESFEGSPWDLQTLFPQVHTLTLNSNLSAGFLEGLFQVMPNLENVYGFPLDCIYILRDGGKFNLGNIKSVDTFSAFSATKIMQQGLSMLANISPKLSLQRVHLRLKISEIYRELWKSCWESLSKILQDNQNTIEHLKIEPLSVPNFLDIFPEMKAVKRLHLSQSKVITEGKFFRDGFDARKIFPNLTEVFLDITNNTMCEWFLNFFPKDTFTRNCFQGVTSLKLKFDYFEDEETRKDLEKVASLFPDVTNFFIDTKFSWLKMGLPQIFRLWPKLISLKLNLDGKGSNKLSGKYLLDSVFTGIPAETCTKLRQHKEKNTDFNNYWKKLGISSMTEIGKMLQPIREFVIYNDNYFSADS